MAPATEHRLHMQAARVTVLCSSPWYDVILESPTAWKTIAVYLPDSVVLISASQSTSTQQHCLQECSIGGDAVLLEETFIRSLGSNNLDLICMVQGVLLSFPLSHQPRQTQSSSCLFLLSYSCSNLRAHKPMI